MLRVGSLCLLALACVLPARSADPLGTQEWKYDVVHRKRGAALSGLVVEQDANRVKIRCISRKPGSPTVVFTEIVPWAEVDRIVPLDAIERQRLEQRLAALKRERDALAGRLRSLAPRDKSGNRSADDPDLRPAAWPFDARAKALGYRSAHFHLVANCRPELALLAAIHLEHIYAAYARTLPPRSSAGKPTTVLLTRSLAEYQKLAKGRGLNLFNPAFYDPGRNQVVCGSDLERLCDDLEDVRKHHVRLRAAMKDRRAELVRAYRGKVPAALLGQLGDAEKRIVAAEAKNDAAFDRVRDRLFRRLYHESFHAYLGTFVYPDRDGALPHWFNEGLAQIFETAIIEAGELRVAHADKARLDAVRQALGNRPKAPLLPLADLLRSEPRHFQVAHRSDQQVSDRHYLAAWALAFHLTFERRLLGTPALDDYVASLKRGSDPLAAFRVLVGKSLDVFEKEHIEYLKKLHSNGTTSK